MDGFDVNALSEEEQLKLFGELGKLASVRRIMLQAAATEHKVVVEKMMESWNTGEMENETNEEIEQPKKKRSKPAVD